MFCTEYFLKKNFFVNSKKYFFLLCIGNLVEGLTYYKEKKSEEKPKNPIFQERKIFEEKHS